MTGRSKPRSRPPAGRRPPGGPGQGPPASNAPSSFQAAGPLGTVLRGQLTDLKDSVHEWMDKGANPLILLRKLFFRGPDSERWRPGLLRALAAQPLVPQELVEAVQRRRALAVRRLQARGYRAVALRIRPLRRLVVGWAIETPLETGLALHGTYGFPILPGSSLKGLAHAVARAATDSTHEGYGSPDRQGQVLFLDALPIPPVRLEEDVVTPHVAPYYADPSAHAPAEYWPPIPVPFLAVGSDQAFRAYLIGRDSGVLARCREDLRRGLEDLGLGAKTAAGYGYCEVQEEPL